MENIILISGENSSGKSVYAEKILAKYEGKRYYIATMRPKTTENFERIIKHKKQREGLGFTDIEIPYSLHEQSFEPDSVILLEDISNLLANNMFEKNKYADDVFCDIICLAQKCRAIIAVTISGIQNNGYDKKTARYIEELNKINQMLYEKAVVSIKMVDGKPVCEKGEKYDFS